MSMSSLSSNDMDSPTTFGQRGATELKGFQDTEASFDAFDSPRNDSTNMKEVATGASQEGFSNNSSVVVNENPQKLIQEISKGISMLSQVTSALSSKYQAFNTSRDTRKNHTEVGKDIDMGKKIISKLKIRLEALNGKSKKLSRVEQTQLRKLSNDFRNQFKQYEDLCQKTLISERNSVDHIRRTSSARVSGSAKRLDYSNYDGDQIYAQSNIITYEEEDLAKREEDIIHINHQLKEIQVAYQEIDSLVNDQNEVTVNIADDTTAACENAERALDNVRTADHKAKYCACSKKTLCCSLCMAVILIIITLSILKSVDLI